MRPLQEYIVKNGQSLRLGYTTGSCAAAAARAAAILLLSGQRVETVRIETPKGISLLLEIESHLLADHTARCEVIKDSGDDPDSTNGARIGCTVTRTERGFTVDGGEGVGRVTQPGLACAVGEAAINPVPRDMIRKQLEAAASQYQYTGGLLATVDVPAGLALAKKTFNPRLGIEGGISILGTSGIVEPMSEKALIATIHAEIDHLHAMGKRRLLIVPGNYGQSFAMEHWGISLDSGVKCSNYIGETLDYAVYRGFEKLYLLGHGGKLVKLAAGIMNTWSRVADGRMEILTAHAAMAGMPPDRLARLMACVTVDAADALLTQAGIADKVWASVGEKIAFHLGHRLGGVEFAFAVFAGRGIVVEHGQFQQIKEDLQ